MAQNTSRFTRAWALFVVSCCGAVLLWDIWASFQRGADVGFFILALLVVPIVLGIAIERSAPLRRRFLSDAQFRAKILPPIAGAALAVGIGLIVFGWSGCGLRA